jgi:hypothetical protein
VRLGWIPVAGSSTTKELKAKLPKNAEARGASR